VTSWNFNSRTINLYAYKALCKRFDTKKRVDGEEYYMVSEEKGATRTLGGFIVKTTFKDLPDDVVQKTKQLILDTTGAALGGYLTDLGTICLKVVRGLGGKPESTLIGSGEKTSCVNAGFVNAKMANALDCDDVFYNYSHFASPTIAAALAVGERVKASGKDILTAVALGYDVTARVGLSCIQPRPTLSFAWHIFGSIVASAKLLDLDVERVLNALGIGCANAPVTCKNKSWPETMVKYGDMGAMAYQGILSSLLAQEGHTGSTNILEGDYGFWRYMGAEKCDYDILLKELGEKWYVMDSAIKPYPACRWISAPLDLFTKIVEDNDLKPKDVERVVVRVHRRAMEKGSIYQPKDWCSAQVSIPYNMALVAFKIPPSSEWQAPELYKSQEILNFHRKVEVKEDPDVERILALPEQPSYGFKRTSASVEVIAKGRTFKARAEYAKGDPWLPTTKMTDDELKNKFRSFASRVAEASLGWRKQLEEVIEKTYNLEKIDDITKLMELLAP